MTTRKLTRLFLVPTLALSIGASALAPIIANAEQINDETTTHAEPKEKGRLAKITAVNGTHYTAEIMGHKGRNFRDMLEPPTEDGEAPEDMPEDSDGDMAQRYGHKFFESDGSEGLDDSERPERPFRKFSEDEEKGDTHLFKDMLPDELEEKLPNDEENAPQNGEKPELEDGDEDRPFRGGKGHFGEDEELETIEFDAEDQDLAVGDMVELTFDGDTVTNVTKLDKDAIPEKPERKSFKEEETSNNTSKNNIEA